MAFLFSTSRPSADDPFLAHSSVARKPLAIHTPSFSHSGQSLHQDKVRAAAIFAASSPVAIPAPAVKGARSSIPSQVGGPSSPSMGYPGASTTSTGLITPQGSLVYTPATPSSPTHPSDVDMKDAFGTPSMSRVLSVSAKSGRSSSSVSHSEEGIAHQMRGSATKLPSKKGSARPPAAIKTTHLACTSAPLTPPLTPPHQPSLPPAQSFAALSSPLQLAASIPAPQPTTISGRLLADYPLHPLFAQQYSIQEELGSGGFGFVVRAERNVDGLSVAVKFIERTKIPNHGWVKSRHWGEAPGLSPMVEGYRVVPLEAFVLRSVRHEGVVAYIDLFEDEKYFYLIMEHHGSPWVTPEKAPVTSPAAFAALTSSPQPMTPAASPTLPTTELPLLSPPRPAPMERRASCDLFECIEQHSRFDAETAKYVFRQVVDVVAALGSLGICHRDIKDENIVISADFKVKLIDFGSAVIFNPREPAPFYTRFVGTSSWASSEILRGEAYQPPISEVWALGVLLSILLVGECPFADAEAAKAGKISKPKVRLTHDAESLMRGCLEVDVRKRLTIEEVRRHPWLAERRW